MNTSVPIVFGSRLHVLYVFAGERRQADVASNLHLLAAEYGYSEVCVTEIDILMDPIKHDMLVKANKANLMTRIYAGEFHAAFLTPACSSWSRVRFAPHGPKPVRNFSNPRGFPWLLGAPLKECTDANELVDLVVELAYAMHSIKGQFLIEHPEDLGCTKEGHMPASIWQLTAVRDLAAETQAHTMAIFQCSPPGSLDPPPGTFASRRGSWARQAHLHQHPSQVGRRSARSVSTWAHCRRVAGTLIRAGSLRLQRGI